VREDLTAVSEYARLLASVGINGCNVNNVNGAAPFLTPEWLAGMKRIADELRPWGVRLADERRHRQPAKDRRPRPSIPSILA
jgi:alpha-glucuronidase